MTTQRFRLDKRIFLNISSQLFDMVAVTTLLARIMCRDASKILKSPPKQCRSLLIISCAMYLTRVHAIGPVNRARQREMAREKGFSVEDFRDKEIRQIEHLWNPYTRFFARRNLEKECESLSLWKNYDRRMKGEHEIPIYQPIVIEAGLTRYLQLLARMGPKGPNHLYTMIRE